jgi:hypothetical protein
LTPAVYISFIISLPMLDVATVSLELGILDVIGLLAGEAGAAFFMILGMFTCESLKSAFILYSSNNLTDNSFYP